jgi:hypothetical protein
VRRHSARGFRARRAPSRRAAHLKADTKMSKGLDKKKELKKKPAKTMKEKRAEKNAKKVNHPFAPT